MQESGMKKRLLWVAAIVALAIPLVYLLRGLARQVLAVEIVRLAWTARILFESLPQTRLWAVFVAIALFIAARSLIERRSPHPLEPDLEAWRPGQVSVVTRWIQRAWRLSYSRRSLARDMRALTLEVLAYQHRTTSQQIRQELRAGRLEVPPEIRAYLDLGQAPVYQPPASWLVRLRRRLWGRAEAPQWRRLWASVRPPQRDPELEQVVQFLESQLGIESPLTDRPASEVRRDS
jgi:hypothetical protein